jgi:hypothetical protein
MPSLSDVSVLKILRFVTVWPKMDEDFSAHAKRTGTDAVDVQILKNGSCQALAVPVDHIGL